MDGSPEAGTGMGTGTLWALLAALALQLFWVIGAWNRLVALRNEVAAAGARVQAAVRERGQLVEPLRAALEAALAGEAGALQALEVTQAQSLAAAAALATRALARDAAAAWVAAETAQAAAASRVFALADGASGAGEAARQPPANELVARWREADQQTMFARQTYNAAAAVHDAALAEFPTSLLVRVFGFAPAGRL